MILGEKQGIPLSACIVSLQKWAGDKFCAFSTIQANSRRKRILFIKQGFKLLIFL